MNFLTPAFVRVNNPEKRKEVTEWLQGIGYYVCPCCLFDGWNTLHCNRIERLKTSCEVHGIPDYDKGTGYNIGWFKADNADKDNPSYDCGTNIELFRALAAMNNENDQEQWYSYTEYPTNESKNGVRRLIFNEHTRFDSFVDVPSGYYRKATVEEIVEYFKNNEK